MMNEYENIQLHKVDTEVKFMIFGQQWLIFFPLPKSVVQMAWSLGQKLTELSDKVTEVKQLPINQQ